VMLLVRVPRWLRSAIRAEADTAHTSMRKVVEDLLLDHVADPTGATSTIARRPDLPTLAPALPRSGDCFVP
jgi:hypothetical protein